MGVNRDQRAAVGLAVVLLVSLGGCGEEHLDGAAGGEALAAAALEAHRAPSAGGPLGAQVVLDPQRLDARRIDGLRLDPEALLDPLPPAAVPPAPFEDGDLCTFGASLWAADCNPHSPVGCVRQLGFESLYPQGLAVGFNGNGVAFSSEEALTKALPGMAPPEVMTRWFEDPGRADLSRLASELVALRMNVDFNAHGLHGRASLGQALVVGGPFEGLLVAEVLELGEWALGGFEGGIARRGVDLEELTGELARLNNLTPDCAATSDLARLPGQ